MARELDPLKLTSPRIFLLRMLVFVVLVGAVVGVLRKQNRDRDTTKKDQHIHLTVTNLTDHFYHVKLPDGKGWDDDVESFCVSGGTLIVRFKDDKEPTRIKMEERGDRDELEDIQVYDDEGNVLQDTIHDKDEGVEERAAA